ncbi:putative leader peptide [Streptomyces sp. NPDC047028]|uniref:putative leader peptide n=1 Tax=Streptomyces sp. NPDC047028 TaxID=3155793 RepID=UPI00340125F3
MVPPGAEQGATALPWASGLPPTSPSPARSTSSASPDQQTHKVMRLCNTPGGPDASSRPWWRAAAQLLSGCCPRMTEQPGCETNAAPSLTWLIAAASLSDVSQPEKLTARLHVDLRRQASAICAVGC